MLYTGLAGLLSCSETPYSSSDALGGVKVIDLCAPVVSSTLVIKYFPEDFNYNRLISYLYVL